MQRFNIYRAEEWIPRENLIYTYVSDAVDLYLAIYLAAMASNTLMNWSMQSNGACFDNLFGDTVKNTNICWR